MIADLDQNDINFDSSNDVILVMVMQTTTEKNEAGPSRMLEVLIKRNQQDASDDQTAASGEKFSVSILRTYSLKTDKPS